jgi:hypothetical protein
MISRPRLVHRIRHVFTWYLSAKLILALLVLAVSAAITVSSTSYQAEMGSAYQVNNNLTVEDKGFTTATTNTTATGTCPTGNVTFTSTPQTANNAITAGDIVYDVQVNTTASTSTLQCFTVTLTLSISGTQTTKSVTTATGSTITAAQTIDCKLDIGTTTVPASPFSFKVTVG